VQTQYRATVRGQHRLQRFRFHRGQVDQDAIRRQRRQLTNRSTVA
jgi:hypothetical protein